MTQSSRVQQLPSGLMDTVVVSLATSSLVSMLQVLDLHQPCLASQLLPQTKVQQLRKTSVTEFQLLSS